MFDELFLQVLDMTRTASVAIIAVLMVRQLLKKVPKIFSYALWIVVLFRLLCPISVEAPVSIMPQAEPLAKTFTKTYTLEDKQAAVSDALEHLSIAQTKETENTGQAAFQWQEALVFLGKYLWLAGMVGMMFYSGAAYVKLRRKLIGAVLFKDNIYAADHIASPFVIGLFRPKIYLPSSL